MDETIRTFYILKSMRYLMLIPNITLEEAYEISENLYNHTIRDIYRMIENQILAG